MKKLIKGVLGVACIVGGLYLINGLSGIDRIASVCFGVLLAFIGTLIFVQQTIGK